LANNLLPFHSKKQLHFTAMKSLDSHPALRIMQTLWFSLFMSQFILMGVLWYLRFGPGAGHIAHGPPPLFAPMFGAVSLGIIGISIFLPKQTMAAKLKSLKIEGRVTDEHVIESLPAIQTALILGMALSESVSLFGFVLGFLGGPIQHVAPFFVVGILSAGMRYPSSSWARKQLGASDLL
jgi:hypothetical protein